QRRRLVLCPNGGPVRTPRRPRCFASTSRRATCLILSGSATDEPPNFMTTVSKSTAAGYRAPLPAPAGGGAVQPSGPGRTIAPMEPDQSGVTNLVHCDAG